MLKVEPGRRCLDNQLGLVAQERLHLTHGIVLPRFVSLCYVGQRQAKFMAATYKEAEPPAALSRPQALLSMSQAMVQT
jgi:hypothetical protein